MNGDPSPVMVDLGELGELGVWLRGEARLLAPGPDTGVHFGQYTPCGETNSARWSVHSMLDGHLQLTERHRREIESLADAIEAATGRYAHTDDSQATRFHGLGR